MHGKALRIARSARPSEY